MFAVSAVLGSLRKHREIFTKEGTEGGICFGKTITSLGRRKWRMAGKREGIFTQS